MNYTSTSEQINEVVYDNEFVKVMLNKVSGQKSLQSSSHFNQGDVICSFGAKTTETHPTYLTIQIGEKQHITLSPEFLQYTNHSCDPNVFFDTITMELICLKEIQPGDELTYFYPSTEWEMQQPFECHCGSENCLQLIKGAKHLSLEVLDNYKFSDYINKKLLSENRSTNFTEGTEE